MTEPWQVKGVSFNTESKFWSFVRSGLRSAWSKHQVKLQFINTFRIKVDNPNPNGRVDKVWGMTCCKCGGEFCLPVPSKLRKKIEAATGEPFNYIEINHKTEAGSLKSKEDLGRFAANLLYVTFDDLEAVCKKCHSIITYMQKEGVDENEALLQKQAIVIIKKEKDNDKKWLIERGVKPKGNAKQRREQIIEELRNVSKS